MTTQKLLVRWFVQYNPLFTASALCMLAGVFLASRALGSALSSLVIELYLALLIATAALLYRRWKERRPAAILGIIALAFLVDPSLQVSALATSSASALTIAWVALFAAKWVALQHAFRLRFSTSALVLPIAGAAFVAFLPNMRVLGLVDGAQPIVVAAMVFALGAIAVLSPMRVESRDAVDQEMFARIKIGAALIGVAGVAYQIANALFAMGPEVFVPSLTAALFVVVIAAKNETLLWISSAVAVALAAHANTQFACAASGLAFAFAARHHKPRVLVASLLAIAMATSGTDIQTVAVVFATIALALLLWRKRAWTALPALAALHATTLLHASAHIPRSSTLWAAVLVVTAFALLPLGALLHRKLARTIVVDDENALSTSTAALTNATQ